MNILASSPFCGLHNPITGVQNRVINLIKELEKRGNNVAILQSNIFYDPADKKFTNIYEYDDNKFLGRILPTTRDINPSFILKLHKIVKNKNIDLIHISHPSGILISKLITKLLKQKIIIIYDAQNVESIFVKEVISSSPKFSKIESMMISLYIRFLEQFTCKYFADHIICPSSKDKKMFTKLYGINENKISVIPSGAHMSSIWNEEKKEIIKKEFKIDKSKLIIFFHGSFLHPPNSEAIGLIENYLAPAFEEYNNVLFIICGTDVPKFERKNIISLGFVKSINKIISIADIAIVPLLRGGGTKLKLFDYLRAGLPVVTTEKGAEGIDMKNREHAIIVDEVNEEFIDAIKFLIDNKNERKKIGENGRKLAIEKYDWNKIGERLNSLYENIRKGFLNEDN